MATHATDVIYDCLVLGAGIAGVTAARNLQAKGLSVLLLEGADRIGGRIYSKRDFVKNPNYVLNPTEKGKYIPIEAGAEYVHVEKKDRYREFWDELRRQRFSTSKFRKTGSLIPPLPTISITNHYRSMAPTSAVSESPRMWNTI